MPFTVSVAVHLHTLKKPSTKNFSAILADEIKQNKSAQPAWVKRLTNQAGQIYFVLFCLLKKLKNCAIWCKM